MQQQSISFANILQFELMRKITLLTTFLLSFSINAQSKLHSHNDYEQERPFFLAYENEFESIEADIFLVDGELYVAHDRKDIKQDRTLRTLYINPIEQIINSNDNKLYKSGKTLQLLIDLKTGYKETLPVLEKQLLEFKNCFNLLQNPSAVKIIVSGSIPPASEFKNCSDIIFFDGRPTIDYSDEELRRVGMISDDYKNYANWKGSGKFVPKDKKRIKQFVEKAHTLSVPARLWGFPDNPNAWQKCVELKFDFINTDKITDLRKFIDESNL